MLKFESTTTPEHIRDIADQILAVAVEQGADQLRQSRLLLVLDELLTNIRSYAYPAEPGPVRVEILAPDNEGDAVLHLRISDWGPPFDPLRGTGPPVLDADLELRPIGGLGVHLVRNMGCDLAYSREFEAPPSEGRNQLTVAFPLR